MIRETKEIMIGDRVAIGGDEGFFLMAGPCVAESKELLFEVAAHLKRVCQTLGIPFVFKASFDKANRTSVNSYRGPGLKKGLEWLAEIKSEFKVPIVTDVHEAYQCEPVAEVADVIQIPAFLCRQTDLVCAAARTGKVVNVKKGQFMAPPDVRNIILKVTSQNNQRVMITERGSSFGYGNLVVDFRAFPMIRDMAVPVIYDVTHSLQQPAALGDQTGGQREYAPYLARAAVACGVDGLFMEVHPDPKNAKSDAAVMLSLAEIEGLLKQLKTIDKAVRS